MPKEKRKHYRRYLRYNAWIGTDDNAVSGCIVSDISDSGARLNVKNPDKLPQSFRLMFSAPGSVDRRCHIVWRTVQQVGVEFEKTSEMRPPPSKTVRSARA